MRLTLVGIGAMASPRYAPAGLLIEHRQHRLMIDGGPGAVPAGRLDAWLVTDARAELIAEIRRLARRRGLDPDVKDYRAGGLAVCALPVEHTSHPSFGYLIATPPWKAVWAPEFFRFPSWAVGADLMFADGSGWSHPIRFAAGVGGHAAVLDVAREAQQRGVRRLVFAHLGRPTLRALDAGRRPPYGEIGQEGKVYRPSPPPARLRSDRAF
jgi:hypothetical protein